ncbi:hypothetical protein AYK26_06540 [Euryarchaeota archaeon SM23-78]|nr:MAG: hypothetical protein AYK26_06540 [Euryarchaeota archaeon SM23-78]MBW3000604.1 hypothetical protein [Candidatus Woesearchaeota archaeon]
MGKKAEGKKLSKKEIKKVVNDARQVFNDNKMKEVAKVKPKNYLLEDHYRFVEHRMYIVKEFIYGFLMGLVFGMIMFGILFNLNL